jgi:hypothetical protein
LALAAAVACGLALAALATGVYALLRAQRLAGAVGRSAAERHAQLETALTALRHETEAFSKRLQRIQPSAVAPTAGAQPGLNLSKRSQALRMHRRGDSAPDIAAALSLPVQEVDLLIKVQRIVLDSV